MDTEFCCNSVAAKGERLTDTQRVVWITGGGTGLGRAMALEFHRKGYFVAVSGRRADRLEQVIALMGGAGMAAPCDVMDEASVSIALEQILAKTRRLDVTVANAGYAASGRVAELTAADWTRQLGVNIVGAATTVRLSLPHLEKTGGRVALVASVASQVNSPGNGAYNASKAGLRAMGLTLAMELHGTGVSCTTIHPGFVESEIGCVDNTGVHHSDWKDRRPAALLWSSEKAGRVMVRAIERRKLEYVFTWHGKIGAWLGRHMPSLVHFLVSRKVIRL